MLDVFRRSSRTRWKSSGSTRWLTSTRWIVTKNQMEVNKNQMEVNKNQMAHKYQAEANKRLNATPSEARKHFSVARVGSKFISVARFVYIKSSFAYGKECI